MKKAIFLMLLLPLAATAQKNTKTHTVKPKENLSSIGRLYNVNGRELAEFNKIDYNLGLAVGQVLKIPAASVTTTETVPVKQPEAVKPAVVKTNSPVYHTVEKKQTLFAISRLYNVAINDIKKWNRFTSDGLSEGASIIVGYNNSVAKSDVPAPVKQPEKPKEEVVVAPKKDIPVVTAKEPEKLKEEVVLAAKKEPEPIVKSVKEEVKAEIKPEAQPIAKTTSSFKGSFFKVDYDEQLKSKHSISENGSGGVFKSTSGWQDGKFYCLHNMAAPGTIIKITNNANGKTVFAKVLDLMPDIKQNNGLVICISNAAADVIGTADGKLNCTLNYSK